MSQSRTTARRSVRPVTIAGAIVLLALIAGAAYGVWYLFLKPEGPAPVGQASLPPLPTSSATAAASSSSASPSAAAASLDGTWNVDTSVGSFSDFSGTFVGYRIQEEMVTIGGNTAVGRTPDVSGSLTMAGTQITAVTITADLTTLQSDDDRRDGQMRRQGLETSQHPDATFTLTSPIELGAVPADGQEVKANAAGQLTLHGVTKDVTIPVTAKRSGNTVVVTGSLPIVLADYRIPKPNSFSVLSIADAGTMEFQVFFTKA